MDGKHVVSGDDEGNIRRWRIEDGNEAAAPLNAKGRVFNIAVSRDGKWVVGGTNCGRVSVWNVESHSKVTEFKGHSKAVLAVDVSPDGARIATGSEDCTACVWSLSTGQRLLGPFKHSWSLAAIKFSPDGRLIATATWSSDSVRVYDSRRGHLVVEFRIRPNSYLNQSLAWASDNTQLFVLSYDSNIHCLDMSTGKSRWSIESGLWVPGCIALASNGKVIAASAKSSVSLWDTTARTKIECDIRHTANIESMAISPNYDLVTAGGKNITVHNLRNMLPSRYYDNVSAFAENVHCMRWLPKLLSDCDSGSVSGKSHTVRTPIPGRPQNPVVYRRRYQVRSFVPWLIAFTSARI